MSQQNLDELSRLNHTEYSTAKLLTDHSWQKCQLRREDIDWLIENARAHQSAMEKIGRVREILEPKLEYAIKHERIPYSVMIGPFSERQVEELSAILTELAGMGKGKV